MPKLPSVAGADIVRALERLGFSRTGQLGSHVKLRRGGDGCIVPLHRVVKKETLAGVLRQAKVSPDDFARALAQ